MWNKPWKYKEGIAVALLLPLGIGGVLQFTLGNIDWHLLAPPVNIIAITIYLAAIIIAYSFSSKFHVIRWATTGYAAVPALFFAAIATISYGVSCIRETLSLWPFVLLYFWLTTICGLTAAKQLHTLCHKSARKGRTVIVIAALLSHLGFFIAVTCATVGYADKQELRMMAGKDIPECMASDGEGGIHTLDFSIILNNFTLEEYPPKLAIIDEDANDTHASTPTEPMSLGFEGHTTHQHFNLHGYAITVQKVIESAEMIMEDDTASYQNTGNEGATTAALVSVNGGKAEWVSNGSYRFPAKSIRLGKGLALMMPQREPRKYTAGISIISEKGKLIKNADIRINAPCHVNGWDIYLLNYDESMGKWSKTTVLELVKDPWLPFVYAGISMMLGGALLLFLAPRRKEERRNADGME